jgi:hypothetical protein
VEGIGYEDLHGQMINESDLFAQVDVWVLNMQLLRYTENGTPYYTKPSEVGCFDLGAKELASEVKYIYDLESQVLEVQFPQGSKPQEVRLYNALDQEVNCSRNKSSDAIRFETNALETGAYFVVVRWDNYQGFFKIVVPQQRKFIYSSFNQLPYFT